MSIPSLYVAIKCGACYANTEHDGDQYVCFDCGLCWSNDDVFDGEPGEFLAEDASACDHPSGDTKPVVKVQPFRTVDGIVKEWREWTQIYGPCVLPAGHKSAHEHPLTTTYRDLDDTDAFLAAALADTEGQQLVQDILDRVGATK